MKFIDQQDRSKLGEGRNYQMGFAMLKKTKTKANGDTYRTVQPISPCKDYLNDVIWSEDTGHSITAYGLSYDKKNIFDKKTSYMVISIMPYWNGSDYPNMEKDIKNLKTNLKNLTTFINFFDSKLGFKLTKISEIEDNKYLVEFSYQWCRGTYLISLFSLLLRVGQFYKNDVTPMEYVKNFKEFAPDIYLLSSAKPKLEKLIKEGIVKQDLKNLDVNSVHNCGIVGYRFQ